MGGAVTILARFKDNSKMSFRISTGCLRPFHDLRMLDEDYFKSYVQKNDFYVEGDISDEDQKDYYNSKCFFAPYHYGLLFIDFKEKQIWSSNNYNGFFSLSSWLVKSHYEYLADCLAGGQFTKETFNITEKHFVNGEMITIRKYHFLEDYSEHFSSLFYIQQVLDRKGTFKYKNEMLPTHLTDIYSILAYINDSDLLLPHYLTIGSVEMKSRYSSNDFCDLDAILPDWTIHNGDGTLQYVKPVFDYMNKHNILNDKDLQYWSDYCNDQKLYEDDTQIDD